MLRTLILKVAAAKWVERFVRRSVLFRKLVKRFIAGDTLEQALIPTESLCEQGFLVTLDYLGENTKSEQEALQAKATYIEMLERIAKSKHKDSINISIKLTQCGLDQGDAFAEANFREVLSTANQLGNFVRVDMESSDYTERTIQMLQRVWPDFKNTGTVLQSYLYRTPDDVDLVIKLQMRTRLVKGAYLEPPDLAHPEKSKTDQAYVAAAKRLVELGNYPAIATHDQKIIDEVLAFVKEHNIDKARFEFQMLFGIRRDLQDSLLKDGYKVRIYIPFGDSWYPYFTRRLAERPANAFFILKSLFKG